MRARGCANRTDEQQRLATHLVDHDIAIIVAMILVARWRLIAHPRKRVEAGGGEDVAELVEHPVDAGELIEHGQCTLRQDRLAMGAPRTALPLVPLAGTCSGVAAATASDSRCRTTQTSTASAIRP